MTKEKALLKQEIPLDILQAICYEVRRDVFKIIHKAESGHLGGCSSSVELMVALYLGGILNIDSRQPHHSNRDRVLIRGHEGPLRYKILSMLGYFDETHLMTYRESGSILKGHEEMESTPGIDITPSGSLGMGLSYGVGSAISAKNNGFDYCTYVFLGDGEEQEGNVSEAARHAASLGLDNIICIIDKNEKQLSRPTSHGDGNTDLPTMWKGYGWNVLEIRDGHNLQEILAVYKAAKNAKLPTVIIAHTSKGKGLEGCENHFNGYHTISSCKPIIVESAIQQQQTLLEESDYDEQYIDSIIQKAHPSLPEQNTDQSKKHISLNITVDPENQTNLDSAQSSFFRDLRKILEENPNAPDFYVMTPDFIYENIVDFTKLREFTHYYDVGIREQHLLAMTHGISISDPSARILLNYGDAFLYRSADQLNAAAQGGSRFMLLAEFSGLCQDRNGRTHQSSGQPGMALTMPGVDFYEPADVQDIYNIFNWFFTEIPQPVYVRSHRMDINPLFREEKDRNNFHCYITHDPGRKPDVVLVASSFLVEQAVKAAQTLEIEQGVGVRVINLINPKKIDKGFLNLLQDGAPVLTVYNGNPRVLQYPIAQAVMEEQVARPSQIKGHGFEFGNTGRMKDLLHEYKLDAQGLAQVVNSNFPKLKKTKIIYRGKK